MEIHELIQSRQGTIRGSILSNFSKGQSYIAKWMKNGKWQYKYAHLKGKGISSSREVDENIADHSVDSRQMQAAEVLVDMKSEMSRLKVNIEKIDSDLSIKKNDLQRTLNADNGKHSYSSHRLESQIKKLQKSRNEMVEHYRHIEKQYNDLKGSYGG